MLLKYVFALFSADKLAMKVTYSWIIYSCLVFGSGILCDRKLERRQAVLELFYPTTEYNTIQLNDNYTESCSVNTDKFHCSNGLCIEWSWVCDGRKDCSDGLDETNELCALYEYGTNMTTGCGRAVVKNPVLIDDDKKSLIRGVSWSVGILLYYNMDLMSFEKRPKENDILCEGSIIAPNVVISVAQCFIRRIELLTHKLSIKKGLLKVFVGKNDRNFTKIFNDEQLLTQTMIYNDSEIINVETVYLTTINVEKEVYYANNIAVIVLENKFSFSNDVAPVCIDWNSKYNVHNGDIGKIFFWKREENGTQNRILSKTDLPFIDSIYCQKKTLNNHFDKFCTTYKSEQRMKKHNEGAGISFLHSNSYFLTGVLTESITYKDGSEDGIFLGFIGLKYYVQWIRGIINKHFIENSCVLPTVEGVLYSYEGSNDILSHGTLINHHRAVIEKCEVGYHKAYPIGYRFCQGKGKWLSSTEKLCFKMCPPLISDSLDIKCSYNGKYANCSNLSIPDTIATTSCKPFYTAPTREGDTLLELNCQANGMWNKELYRCNPNCGRVYVKNHVLINNGDKALVGTAPWNVGIYQLNKIDSNYDMICGGSIISPNLVISAAHCFWQNGMLSKNISITDGLYKIAVGKYDRNFTIIDNEFTQIMNVEMIHLKEGYYGTIRFHAEDIAIIVLQNIVSFSNGVSPVCIDWNNKYNVVNGDQGKIVGWGKTEKGISSPILLEASLPYIDRSTCRNMYTNGFELFMTVDKFCAGSKLVSEQGVEKGDSGAGLCFVHSNSYYLTGVVSIKDPNTNYSIAVFTDIKHHIQWILGLFNKHN